MELMERASRADADLRSRHLAPVLLESNISFRREVRSGEVVRVSCEAKFGSGKTFRMDSAITKADGTTAAEITCTLGVMHLQRRRLVGDPAGSLEQAGVDISVLSRAE